MEGSELDRTQQIMGQLLGPHGCPWTKAQTHETLAQYAVEEAYELADSIATGKAEDIKEELGDLWLQVAYHAAIAKDFDINDVAEVLNEKLIRRHPHVFGDSSVQNADEVADAWDQIKAKEKVERQDPFDGISPHLDPLLMAAKVRWRGRDSVPIPSVEEAQQGVTEALKNLADAQTPTQELIGEALGALVTLGVSADIDPDMALRKHTVAYQEQVRAGHRKSHKLN